MRSLASIGMPLILTVEPSNRIYSSESPTTNLPAVRSKNDPLSVPLGAASASGIVPPCSVPAVTSPTSAARALRVLTLISVAVTALAVILGVVIASSAIFVVVIAASTKLPLLSINTLKSSGLSPSANSTALPTDARVEVRKSILLPPVIR